jgi:hypothetical protein
VAGDDEGLVELSDAINLVRDQLIAAQLTGRRVVAGQVLTFVVGKVSIEFVGEMKRVAGLSGGVKFAVLTAEAKAERSATRTHKVQVELIPQSPEGASFSVADGVDSPPAE